MIRLLAFAAAVFSLCSMAQAQEARVRVVDVGQALCTVISIPGGHDILFDAGHWNGNSCTAAVEEMVEDDRIEMIFLSHSDADHLGELPDILRENSTGAVFITGHEGTSGAWEDAINALGKEIFDDATVINLASWPVDRTNQFTLGDATIELLAGWHDWDSDLSEGSISSSERRNAISLVVRVSYGAHSVLLSGDSIGRGLRAPDTECDHAERWLVENRADQLPATVFVASHHGGNNGNAACFLEAISPEFVIFSAGRKHHHPTIGAARRVLEAGVPLSRIFRTDRSDHEPPEDNDDTDEWPVGGIFGCEDLAGDDDVEIVMPLDPALPISVGYRQASTGC